MRAASGLRLLSLIALAACASAPQPPATVEGMHVLDGGSHHTDDLSLWSTDAPASQPWDFANHCYLIRHPHGLLLWDSGFADAIADTPEGVVLAGGKVRVRVRRTLAGQLARLGVRPEDVTHLAFSHFHMDHVGNANLFAGATLYIQQAEADAAFGPDPERFGFQPDLYQSLRQSPMVKLSGDHDVFGDGSVVILATPGHTPGHQSLLVRLPRTGAVILTGDVAHFRANWNARRVPATNFDREQSLRSMARLEALAAVHGARVWINHDKAPGEASAPWPAFIE